MYSERNMLSSIGIGGRKWQALPWSGIRELRILWSGFGMRIGRGKTGHGRMYEYPEYRRLDVLLRGGVDSYV